MTNPIVLSAVPIHIVLAFLQFLSTVERFVGADKQERLHNIKESLVAFFNIPSSMLEATVPNVSLDEENQQNGSTSTASNTIPQHEGSPSSSTGIQIDLSLTMLYHEFHVALAALGFFDMLLTGEDYGTRKSRAKRIFKEAIEVLKEAGRESDRTNLAHGLKILGNNAMRNEWYERAIEMYSCAHALFKNNAVYICNRAAAFTKGGRFEEAINDCYQAIKLEEGYVMAYYRIGFAYYEQGRNLEAIRHGFLKVLELDPQNQDAMISLQLADSKLRDEVACLREQIGSLRLDGVPPVRERRKSTVLMFRGPQEGGNGPWELAEDANHNDNDNDNDDKANGDTLSVADFIDTHVCNIPPPE